MRSLQWSVGVAVMMAVTAGCGTSGASDGDTAVHVVASTNVWGDVVKQVAGDLAGSTVEITSIISDPDADPHSYEANTQNQLALSKADLVVENGGGYDDFIDSMLKTAKGDPMVLNAVDISGHTAPAGGELNEHIWYDFPSVQKIADQIEAALAKADATHASTYAANAKAFDEKLAGFEATEAAIKAKHAGEGAAITEPVPLYLLEAAGLVNKTPEEFSEGIEEGTDVSPAVLKETTDLFATKAVKILAYNEQTTGPETDAVLKAAKENGIPVVGVRETLPDGQDYLAWMADDLAQIQSALG
ncbi:metal ABC transporter solute-binding protein, Zn/Mn family [Nocardioides sp. Kera G14]|uniref:metal ABC transporter solute-binding protein, Zn/Mn family n=1 Tax=Nocardioides sp. Kera G14 TaxID=2884264 RepID=UPI001D104993|nr:zinc ABC transporter substrate-binding protein [Nocardioides sp. Kera G14]UDY24498.1 zinc ABC transporter substrate-binding protein [Nocardioides sp. Kera G14]